MMKRPLKIFELSKSEQRVVLVVMLILIAIAFVGYERRVHRINVRTQSAPEMKTSPSPAQTENKQ
jgi:hypothetical protein